MEQGQRTHDGMTATYSVDDNKVRLYASSRLDADTYARVKAAGFRWAPKQDLFVAPMWTPEREDLLLELAGEIGDEDTSLVDRAEERAERFEEYSERRADAAEGARKAVAAIADNVPLGQPILVGHHSEKHARKDAERIENGMRRAVKLWETSKYWEQRAKGAIRNAKYKERPDVRARRIKGLEADARKQQKHLDEAAAVARKWALVDQPEKWKDKADGTKPSREDRARYVANLASFPVAHENADGSPCDHYGSWSAWNVLKPDGERYQRCPARTVDEVLAAVGPYVERIIAHHGRWLQHYRNRLAYERAMLADAGGLAADKHEIEVGGQVLTRYGWGIILKLNKKAGQLLSVTVTAKHFYRGRTTASVEEIKDYRAPSAEDTAKVKAATKIPPLCNYPHEKAAHITKAQFDSVRSGEGKGTATLGATETAGPHRIRSLANYLVRQFGVTVKDQWGHTLVYLTDAPRKDPPSPVVVPAELPRPEPTTPRPRKCERPEPTAFDAMREQLRTGVQVVSAPQLFPTPPEIARRMVELAEIKPGLSILEPSAGTGNLLQALQDTGARVQITAIEINRQLADELQRRFASVHVTGQDFLACNGSLGPDGFDRIIMNPPFERGADIQHIRHALGFLKPGGRLVALCANGPRQQEAFQDEAELWEELPAGSFASHGTNVNVALMVLVR